MPKIPYVISSILLCLVWLSYQEVLAQQAKPNIIVILCDDLGIGDASCFNPQGKIKTPNIDAMARGGLKFTMRTAVRLYVRQPDTPY